MSRPSGQLPAAPVSSQERTLAILARKTTLLILLVLVTVIGSILFSRIYWERSHMLTFLLADSLVILVAGLSSRWVLRGQPAWIRLLTAIVMLLAGLAILGFLTGGLIGVDPWRAGLRVTDWLDIGQSLIGLIVVLLCLFSWPGRKVSQPSTDQPEMPSSEVPGDGHAAGSVPASSNLSPDGGMVDRPQSADAPPEAVRPAKRKRKGLFHRKSSLRLSKTQENRCPYCLEVVEPDDPRGIVECKICHTLHHADCWAITGACQVPHYTS